MDAITEIRENIKSIEYNADVIKADVSANINTEAAEAILETCEDIELELNKLEDCVSVYEELK